MHSAVRRNNYELYNKYQGMGALGMVARLLTSGTMLLNNSTVQTPQESSSYYRMPKIFTESESQKVIGYTESESVSESKTERQIFSIGYNIEVESERQSESERRNRKLDTWLYRTRNYYMTGVSISNRVQDTILNRWQATVEKIRQISEQSKGAEQPQSESTALKQIENSVNKGVQMTGESLPNKIRNFLQSGVELGMSLAGRNTTSAKNERKPITLLSPRFLSLFPDDGDSGESVSLLSPSVLSMHDQGKGLEKNTSLPSLLKDFSPTDRQQWINFIMEAAGINERTNAMLSEVDEIANLAGIADPPLMGSARANKTGNELMIDGEIIAQFNDTNILSSDDQKIHEEHIDADLEMRKLQVWDQLTNSYTPQQLRELNKTGTAILTPAQLNFIYGSESPYHDQEALTRFNSLTSEQLARAIEEDVHRMADMHTMQFPFPALKKGATARGVKRVKRQVVNLILSPALLTARVSAPLLAGPVILSPRVLTPIINSAIGFGTVILSPGVFVPLILSPYLTRPQILSPGVFNPAILSPLLFSPSILSPQVFSPTILTPFVFVPLILNPIVGSPLILSPRVLSPVIFSYRLLYALILSPYVLTPSIYSPKPDEIRVLSPSWLS